MMLKTHYCGKLGKDDADKKVTLAGWVQARRDHGKLIFLDLRDREGIVQVVVNPEISSAAHKIAESLRPEFVVQLSGMVKRRPEKLVNLDLRTGEIEVEAQEIKILAESKTLPFEIAGDGYKIKEDLRWQYRYLDLRRERALKILKKRAGAMDYIRHFLGKKGFLEIETPILTKATPEGARDFLAPSRMHPGKFYALPQSPQQYKQLLMIAGVEKYFQFPRCLRDEDLRSDRLLEFTQLDIEMAFCEQEDILNLTEELIIGLTQDVFKKEIEEIPFPRLTHAEAMEKYHCDKPDLRKDKKGKKMSFVWVLDFPMFEYHKEEKKWGPQHHPFTAVNPADLELLAKGEDLGKVRALQYDLALNGNEVFGGSMRTTDPKILSRVFELLGHKEAEIKERFGHLLEAFGYGAPPHGGIASGLDRLLMVLLEEKNIREIVPFPTTGRGTTAVMDAPSRVDEKQLKELHLKIAK
ncbi:aspartate--tRNA ligase [bacterium (Candidatus Torokbacteria) CG09_land_8_20_14_0_10_42_11]|nr:MAG: aspartate--tRNA ligase [bacterium (Candidatus Torokbacteria) CG09_land_8_20_14_0_10_42_11]